MTARPQPLTLADFVRWESEQPDRHEFADGIITAFAGGTKRHAMLARDIMAIVQTHLRGGRCEAFGSDALVVTGSSGRYPDLTVTCDERDLRDLSETTIGHPKLVLEILSETTAAVDRGAKLDEYRAIASLEEYALVDSRRRWIATYRRVDDAWLASLPASSGTIRLASIALDLDVDALYAGVGL